MGQSTSSSNDNNSIDNKKEQNIKVKLTKTELYDLFYTRCLQLLKPIEISIIKSKLIENNKSFKSFTNNDESAEQEEKELLNNHNISKSYLGQWILSNNNDLTSTIDEHYYSSDFNKFLDLFFKSMKRIGQSPFLNNKVDEKVETLDLKEFIISSIFLLGRFKKLFGANEYDEDGLNFIKLWYISINYGNGKANDIQKVEQSSEEDKVSVYLVQSFEETDSIEIKSKKVNWKRLEIFRNYDDINYAGFPFKIDDLKYILTFDLILNAIPLQNHQSMDKLLISYLNRWKEFEIYSNYIIKYLDISDDRTEITFDQFYTGIRLILPYFISQSSAKLMSNWILSTNNKLPQQQQLQQKLKAKESEIENDNKVQKPSSKFTESKLVTIPFISYISAILRGIGSKIEITNENMFKLYSGSESGFSIRSLETKIFKWQSPTLFIVSGKRIKQKTIETNKRYEKFDNIFPNYFLKSESKLKDWQASNDRVTYCVLVNHPWVNSNKKNFGDDKSIILSISPHLDYYKSISNEVLQGKSIYFNNLGMGLGFGNSQPLNKNNLQKYYPGDVSLTIESNLEFAIFRHLVGHSTSQATTYFQTSKQAQLSNENFEDRFTIIDLEVWGIGSVKNLEEQKKQWEWEEKIANERQNVNLKNMGEERAFLEMVGLVGNHGGNGGSV
ncbi:RTC5 [Candida jiufengensis]|uniref:RTC5 n=1 Tax=Candida jiufengensis TaxID=497108 RepID=UPI002224D1D8|nr:RTC5 [Candida jiufengensis]KAI5951186.1 RTC5 [Candida jiufengensis]